MVNKVVEDDITYVIMPSLNLAVTDCRGRAETRIWMVTHGRQDDL